MRAAKHKRNLKDHHLHLSGGTDLVVLWELVSEGGLKTQAKSFWDFRATMTAGPAHVQTQKDYLDIIHTIDTAQSSPGAVERCAYSCFASSYLSGCADLELRWNPVKRSQNGRIDLDRLIVAARSGMERATTTFGIEGSMILCFGRDCTPKENEANFKMALRYQGKGIWGIDTAGPETEPLMKRHPYLRHYYAMAGARKLRRKCHTAETLHDWTEAELAYVLEVLQPEYLGHGVQIHRFPRLMKLASSKKTELEICLSSNLATGVVRTLNDFKRILRRLEQYQVNFAFHTDATFLLETNISREHALAEAIRNS